MKNVKFLLAIFTVAVVMASCVSTQNVGGEDLDESRTRRIGDRVYVDDPYYGTVVLERDPFTGRYYDVTYGYRGYGSSYNSWNTRRYGNSGRYYRSNVGGTVQRPSQEQNQQKREEARKKILGN